MTASLAKTNGAPDTALSVFTPNQEQMIRDSFMSGASKEDAAMLMEVARTRRLNPLLKQVHFVSRFDKKKNRNVWSVQVSIDGLRAIAERTGNYDGQDEPEFGPLNESGYPQWAKIKVYRKDWSRPAVGMVYWEEYVQLYDGKPTKFWNTMPRVMLAKCAESVAMRKAFPEDMSGLYTPEEMGQADNERLPRIGPTSEADEDGVVVGDEDVFESFRARLTALDADIQAADSYDKALECAARVGTTDKQSELTKQMQAAYENGGLNGDMRSALGKLWQRCSRQVKIKLEKLKTDAAAAFTDADPAEQFDRSL